MYVQQVKSSDKCAQKPHSQQETSRKQAHICFCFPYGTSHKQSITAPKTAMHVMYVCTQKIWQDLLHCVVQLNEPCPWKAFLVVDVWEHGPTINPVFVKWYVCSVWGKYGTVFQLCKKTYRWSTSIVTLVPPGIYPENMNALVHTPCVIAPYNFVCIQETVQY